MKVLVVGYGYVGLALGAELVRQGHTVYGVRRASSAPDELQAVGIIPVVADICQPASLRSLPQGCEWVVNCVSASGGGLQEYQQVYLEGTRNLLNWMAGSPPQKFVYTSSTGVYGQIDGSVVDETGPTGPAAETAKVLVQAERLLLEAAQRTGFPAVILRVAGIYGPGRGYWLKQFLAGEARLEGKGDRILNMIHRDDVVGAIIAALERGQAGQIYNAVDDRPVTQLELFQWFAGKLGRPLPPGTSEPPALSQRGLTSKRVSNRRLKLDLGYRFKYPTFREGLAGALTEALRH